MRIHDIENRPINERFDHLLQVISSQRFLTMKGLGNEIPFFICPYNVTEAIEMERIQDKLTNQLEMKGFEVLRINLYDVSITLLKERGIWERMPLIEQETEKEELLKNLYNVLNPEDYLVPAINEILQATSYDVLFIHGVGEVFPYIRSHAVLNNLEKCAKKKPMVMFFPGTYTHSLEFGASLDLFGSLHDDKYYRAFNIYEYQLPQGEL